MTKAEQNKKKREKRKYNMEAYLKMGYTSKLARKYRDRSPFTTLTISLHKHISLQEVKLPEVYKRSKSDKLEKVLVDYFGIDKKDIAHIKRLGPAKQANLITSATKIYQAGMERGMTNDSFKRSFKNHLEGYREPDFWRAARMQYETAIGVRAETARDRKIKKWRMEKTEKELEHDTLLRTETDKAVSKPTKKKKRKTDRRRHGNRHHRK